MKLPGNGVGSRKQLETIVESNKLLGLSVIA